MADIPVTGVLAVFHELECGSVFTEYENPAAAPFGRQGPSGACCHLRAQAMILAARLESFDVTTHFGKRKMRSRRCVCPEGRAVVAIAGIVDRSDGDHRFITLDQVLELPVSDIMMLIHWGLPEQAGTTTIVTSHFLLLTR
jgi:hypothetical protein